MNFVCSLACAGGVLLIAFLPARVLPFGICAAQATAVAQRPGAAEFPAGTAQSWVQAAADNEVRIIDQDGSYPARYLIHKGDARGDVVRDTIESRDGAVARLVERDGKPLTAEEDAAERRRLQDLLASPEDYVRRHKRNGQARGYSTSLVRMMPQAMIFTYAPGQPQPAGSTSRQVVVDFRPDPNFHPPTMVADLLTGIEGRLWIDARSHTLTRGEARVSQPVDFGWGMLARIYPGGTVEFEQAQAGNGHWVYSHLEEHIRIREVMVKTVAENTVMTLSNLQILPAPLSWQEAIRKLLEKQ